MILDENSSKLGLKKYSGPRKKQFVMRMIFVLTTQLIIFPLHPNVCELGQSGEGPKVESSF